MGRIARWLRPGGKLFVHIFTHKDFAYHFEDNGEDDWMTRWVHWQRPVTAQCVMIALTLA